MSVGLVILLLVPPGEIQAPLVSGIVSAASRSLGANSRVLVNAVAPTSDDDAVALSERLHANAVVTLRWLEGGRISLHAHRSGQAGWTDRFFVFSEADALDERGRTIGFTLASMVQTEIPPIPGVAPSSESRREPRSEPGAASGSASAPSSGDPSWLAARHVSLEASAQVHVAVQATTIGAVFRGAFSIAPALSLTTAGAWRTGTMNTVDGQLRIFSLSAGVRIPIVQARAARPYELALLGEWVASHEAISRTTAASAETQTEGRWVPGAQFQVAGAWFFSSRIAAAAALGAQLDFGSTDVVVNGHTVATVSPFRGVGELGVRVRF